MSDTNNKSGTSQPPAYYTTVVVPEGGGGLNAVEWYKTALNATEKSGYKNKDGTLMHGHIESAYGFPMGIDEVSPKESHTDPVEGVPKRGVSSYQYINVGGGYSCDGAVQAMENAGATVTHPPRDLFYGHRVGRVVDKFGVAWAFSSLCEPRMEEMPEKWGR